MKYPSFLSGCILFTALIFSSCVNATGGGPNAWIDQPLEAHNPLPLGPVTLQAHASDSDGVASLEFSIDGQIIQAVSAGGARLGQAAVQWNPPNPGTYTLSVTGMDNTGQIGNPANGIIIIVGEEQVDTSVDHTEESTGDQASEPPAAEETEEPVETESPKPDQVEDPTETDPPPVDEPETEDPPQDSAPIAIAEQNSNCRQGPSSAYKIETIIMEGQQASIVGRSGDMSWLVLSVEGGNKECWIAAYLVKIQGDITKVAVKQPPPLPITDTPTPTSSPTATVTPSATPTPTLTQTPPPPPADNTPPTITSILTFFPNPIYHGNCPDDPTTSSYSLLGVYDEGGIAHVEAAWTLADQSGSVVFDTPNGTDFGAIFGPFLSIGELNMYGSVVDNAGNWTPFADTLTVKSCIE